MTTLAEYFDEKERQHRWWKRRIVGEVVHLGNGLHFVEWRNGKTGKVSQFGVFRPDPKNTKEWEQVGWYRQLQGYRHEWIEIQVHPNDDVILKGEFKDHQQALDYLARTARDYVK